MAKTGNACFNLKTRCLNERPDFSEISGFPILKRSLEICVAGMFNILLFGHSSAEANKAIDALSAICPDPEILFQYQTVIRINPCFCGNLGKDELICHCSEYALQKYWKKMGGLPIASFDMRVPLFSIPPSQAIIKNSESSDCIKKRVTKAFEIQEKRFANVTFSKNSEIPSAIITKYCKLDDETRFYFERTMKKFSFSSGAALSILKIARTIADLNNCENIQRDHFLESVFYRRYGDRDLFWREIR